MISLNLKKRPIEEEDDEDLVSYLTYCKRYWGKAGDYGDSTWPDADKFIEDNKSIWEKQAEHEDLEEGEGEMDLDEGESGDSDEDEDKMDVSGGASNHSAHQRLRTSATKEDYHESCRLLYADPSPTRSDPILIRAEYSPIYDRLKFIHEHVKNYKAVITGQPGIGNLLCAVSYMANIILRQDLVSVLRPVATNGREGAGTVQDRPS
jgi:hypothetical protein